jgi:hypothetical protein
VEGAEGSSVGTRGEPTSSTLGETARNRGVGEPDYAYAVSTWPLEEGEYENAAYDQAECEASFGPGVGVAVVANGEGHVEDAIVKSPLESESKEVPPSERCGAEDSASVASGGAHREYVHGPQCKKHLDLLIELDLTDRASYNLEKFRRYDAFLTAWWSETRRYQQLGTRPGVVFVCTTPEMALSYGRGADELMRGSIQ